MRRPAPGPLLKYLNPAAYPPAKPRPPGTGIAPINMMASTRKSAVRTISKAKDMSNSSGFDEVHTSKEMKLQELYGINVFNDAVQRRKIRSGSELVGWLAEIGAGAQEEAAGA